MYFIITTIVAFDICFEYFNGENTLGFRSHDPNRIASFLRDELKIGHFMLGFCFISIGFFFEKYFLKSINYKIFGFFLIIFFFSSLLLTGERANSLRGILIALAFILLAKKEIFRHKIFFFSSIILILTSIYFFSNKIKYRFDVILNPIENKGFVETFKETHHAAHFYTAFKILNKYPFFGVGNKNFREECLDEKYNNKSYARINERCSTHPHQVYLELLSEHGIIGFIIILFVIFYSIFKSFLNFNKKQNLIQLGAILFVASTFMPLIPSGSFFTSFDATIFWFNYAIMLSYNKV